MEIQRQRKIATQIASYNSNPEKKDKKPKNFSHVKAIPSIVTFIDSEKGLSLLVGVVPEQKNYLGNKFNLVT